MRLIACPKSPALAWSTNPTTPTASSASPCACTTNWAQASSNPSTKNASPTNSEAGIKHERQVDLPIHYNGVNIGSGGKADMIVANRLVLELKSVEQIAPIHEAQLLTYLRLSNSRVGLLLNFNTVALKDGIRRKVL